MHRNENLFGKRADVHCLLHVRNVRGSCNACVKECFHISRELHRFLYTDGDVSCDSRAYHGASGHNSARSVVVLEYGCNIRPGKRKSSPFRAKFRADLCAKCSTCWYSLVRVDAADPNSTITASKLT